MSGNLGNDLDGLQSLERKSHPDHGIIRFDKKSLNNEFREPLILPAIS